MWKVPKCCKRQFERLSESDGAENHRDLRLLGNLQLRFPDELGLAGDAVTQDSDTWLVISPTKCPKLSEVFPRLSVWGEKNCQKSCIIQCFVAFD